MASSYDNDLRLNEMATGDQSGAWGTVTNLNLEMIAEAFSYGTRAIANAATDNITLADGALDADRSMYLRLSGGGQACTVTFLPATISKVWLIENATSATLTMKQGSSPAGIAIPAGQVKMIATDGGGSTNGVVYDLLTDVNLAGTTVTDIITANQATVDDIDLNGKVITMTGSSGDTATITVAADGALEIATTDAAAAAGHITLKPDGSLFLNEGSTAVGEFKGVSSDLVIKSKVQDKDILLKGDDGGTEITALSLDMSEGGNAVFSGTVTRDLTRGSIDVGNSSGVSTPLAAGTSGYFLKSDGTDVAWSDMPSGFMGSVITVSSSGETTLTAAQSGSLIYVTNSAAILKLPTATAGVFFGLRNTTDSDVVVRAASGVVYMNSRIMPSKIVEADGLGIIVGVDSTHWVADFDMPSAAIINRYHNASNASGYSETRTISAGTTSIGIFMQGGQAVVSYGSIGSTVYYSAGCGGSSYSEKIITSSLPSSLTISGNYQVQDQSNVGTPNDASRLRVNGTGVDMYAGYPQGGLSYNPTSDLNGGVASGGDFNANGGQGRGSSGTNYNNANLVLSGGAGSGSPAGVGGRAYNGTSNSGTGKLYNGTVWVSNQNSSQNMRHGGGLGGNDGTATAGGVGGSRDSNAVAWTNYVGKEFYLPAGGTNAKPTSEGYDSGTYYGHYDTGHGPDGATFGVTPTDLVLLYGPSSSPLFTREPKAYGASSFGTAGRGFQVGQAVIIEFKG
jgi:hypothetical protein